MQPLVSSACCCSLGFLCVVQVVLCVLLFTEIPACCFTLGSLRVVVHRNSFLLLFLIGSFLMLLTGFLLVRKLLTTGISGCCCSLGFQCIFYRDLCI